MKEGILLTFLFCTVLSAQEMGGRYLIITDDLFYDAIQPLANWKHRMGLRTKVVKLSQIGSTTGAIKGYVDNAYDTWQIRPEFLLLVGSPGHIPFYVFSTYCYSDNYYTNMDFDIYNEILSGRLTVHTVTEAQTVVNKILLYEKTPDLTDSLWFINACLIANEEEWTYPPPYWSDDSIYWSDVLHAKAYMLANGYNTIDTLSKLLGDNNNTVINRVNQGRAFVLYRGCAFNQWAWPFEVDASQIQNGAKLPIVLSITCGTLGTGYTPAIVERWFTTGTPTLPRGGAGYFATTTSGYDIAHLRSAVCKGFFDALFGQGKQTFGEACEGGRTNVYNMYNSSDEYRGFTTVGDPSMMIWTAVPKPLEVHHDSALSVEDESLVVSVLCQDVPLESALVCVVLDTVVYDYGHTGSDGEIVFNFDELIPGNMHITVTARNKIPFLDSITVGPPGINETAWVTTVPVSRIEVWPNPFTVQTQIRYPILDAGYLIQDQKLVIYDASGRRVRSLNLESGIEHQESVFSWDGTDDDGRKLPGGVYLLNLDGPTCSRAIPVVLMR
ncbi:MAG: hypothetical protein JSW49_03400 [candidate division WOR-3 bacterium]|nr:MAG: hypothetical protein JSW49_03400 [candidate division WOR-3 bacterium]